MNKVDTKRAETIVANAQLILDTPSKTPGMVNIKLVEALVADVATLINDREPQAVKALAQEV